MENIVQLVFNYGIGFVIVGLFIYDWFTNKKDIKMTLKQNEKCPCDNRNRSLYFKFRRTERIQF